MEETKVFVVANEVLLALIKQIKSAQWDMAVPAEMTWQPDQRLRDIVNYHIYDDAWVPDMLAGRTMAEVGNAYDFLRSTTDSVAEYEKYNSRANKAVESFKDFDRIAHLSYGDYTAREYLTHITLYRGLHIFDIANLIGAKIQVPDELVRGLWEIVEPQAQVLRDMHVIGAEVPVPKDAPLIDRLLGLTGRHR
jgi:uncharacterized protein (TIGR03086 family)